jgi:hypothetical protein
MTQESTNTTADWQSEAMHQNKLLHEMTDEELITYLRFQGLDKDIAAASRIEKLAAQLKTVLEREAETQARHDSKMDALEAKLADALDDAQKADAHATDLEADRRNTYIALQLITRLHSEVEAKLGRAEMLLYDAMVQLEDGKIKTRRNRARLIREFLDEIRGRTK